MQILISIDIKMFAAVFVISSISDTFTNLGVGATKEMFDMTFKN